MDSLSSLYSCVQEDEYVEKEFSLQVPFGTQKKNPGDTSPNVNGNQKNLTARRSSFKGNNQQELHEQRSFFEGKKKYNGMLTFFLLTL